MITTLYGENSFALDEELHHLIADFVKIHGELSIVRLNGDEVELGKIEQALTSLPLLVPCQLVVLKSPSKNKQFLESYAELLGGLSADTDLLIVEHHLDKRLRYFGFLKRETDLRIFNELDQEALIRWLVEAAKRYQGSITVADALYLIGRVGTQQQLLVNELQKLILYNPVITRQTIDDLTQETAQSTIFELLEAAFKGQKSQTIRLYTQQRSLRVEPQQIIALLSWQLNVLAVIKTAQGHSLATIAKQTGINPYVVRKSDNLSRHLHLEDIKTQLARLKQIDIGLKQTSINADEALQHYLLTL
jgi:DNA polymerase III delta subunit